MKELKDAVRNGVDIFIKCSEAVHVATLVDSTMKSVILMSSQTSLEEAKNLLLCTFTRQAVDRQCSAMAQPLDDAVDLPSSSSSDASCSKKQKGN